MTCRYLTLPTCTSHATLARCWPRAAPSCWWRWWVTPSWSLSGQRGRALAGDSSVSSTRPGWSPGGHKLTGESNMRPMVIWYLWYCSGLTDRDAWRWSERGRSCTACCAKLTLRGCGPWAPAGALTRAPGTSADSSPSTAATWPGSTGQANVMGGTMYWQHHVFREVGSDIVDGADMFTEDDEEPETRRRGSHSHCLEEIISCRDNSPPCWNI